jgi:hypothetical protein
MCRSSIAVPSAAGFTPGLLKTQRLILCLIFFVPAFALLGAFATLDSGERTPWLGLVYSGLSAASFSGSGTIHSGRD